MLIKREDVTPNLSNEYTWQGVCVSQGHPCDISAVDFLIKVGLEYPGEVHVLALGPLSNVAFALQKHPEIATIWVRFSCFMAEDLFLRFSTQLGWYKM